MILEGSHRFFIQCEEYRSPTPYRTLDDARNVIAKISACRHEHWIMEMIRLRDRWHNVKRHEYQLQKESVE